MLLCSPGKYGQWIAAVTACLCSLTTGQGFAWSSPMLARMRAGETGFTLTDEETSWVITFAFIGNVISPLPMAYVMDLIGRKATITISALASISSWIIIYFSVTSLGLCIARFLAGVWAGVVYAVVPVFIGEVVDPEIRGAMAAVFSAMMYVGALYETLAGMISYKFLCAISTLPSVVIFFAFLLLPESPYYYLMKNNKENAKRSLIWLTGSANKLDDIEIKVKDQLSKKGTFGDLVKTKSNRKAFIIVEMLCIVQRGAGITLLFSYLSDIVPPSILSIDQSYILLCIVWVTVSVASTLFMDRFGRRAIMAFSSAGTGLGMLGIIIWFYLKYQQRIDMLNTDWMPLFFLVFSGIFYSTGLVTIPQLVQGEMFPVSVKSKGSAIASITSALTSAVTIKIYQPLKDSVGPFINFVICLISCLLGISFALSLMIETKGKTLESIQDLLENNSKTKSKTETKL